MLQLHSVIIGHSVRQRGCGVNMTTVMMMMDIASLPAYSTPHCPLQIAAQRNYNKNSVWNCDDGIKAANGLLLPIAKYLLHTEGRGW